MNVMSMHNYRRRGAMTAHTLIQVALGLVALALLGALVILPSADDVRTQRAQARAERKHLRFCNDGETYTAADPCRCPQASELPVGAACRWPAMQKKLGERAWKEPLWRDTTYHVAMLTQDSQNKDLWRKSLQQAARECSFVLGPQDKLEMLGGSIKQRHPVSIDPNILVALAAPAAQGRVKFDKPMKDRAIDSRDLADAITELSTQDPTTLANWAEQSVVLVTLPPTPAATKK